jgi:hypothetical protein
MAEMGRLTALVRNVLIILSAVGHNFRRILAWLRNLLRLILLALWQPLATMPAVRWAS